MDTQDLLPEEAAQEIVTQWLTYLSTTLRKNNVHLHLIDSSATTIDLNVNHRALNLDVEVAFAQQCQQWHEAMHVLTALSCCRGYSASENPSFWHHVIESWEPCNYLSKIVWSLDQLDRFPHFRLMFGMEAPYEPHYLTIQEQVACVDALFASPCNSDAFQWTMAALSPFQVAHRPIRISARFLPRRYDDSVSFRDQILQVLDQIDAFATHSVLNNGLFEFDSMEISLTCISLCAPGFVKLGQMLPQLPMRELELAMPCTPTESGRTLEEWMAYRVGMAHILNTTFGDQSTIETLCLVNNDLKCWHLSAMVASMRACRRPFRRFALHEWYDGDDFVRPNHDHLINGAILWLIYAVFHPTSSFNLESLVLKIEEETIDITEHAAHVLEMVNPAPLLLACTEDMAQLQEAHVEFPQKQLRASLRTTSIQFKPMLFPKDYGANDNVMDEEFVAERRQETLYLQDWDQSKEVEVLALHHQYVCVLVPDYGCGWIDRTAIQSIREEPVDMTTRKSSVKQLTLRANYCVSTAAFLCRLDPTALEFFELDIPFGQEGFIQNDLLLPILSSFPKLKHLSIRSQGLEALAQLHASHKDAVMCPLETLWIQEDRWYNKSHRKPFPIAALVALLTHVPCTMKVLRVLRLEQRLEPHDVNALTHALTINKTLVGLELVGWHPAKEAQSLTQYHGEWLVFGLSARDKAAFISCTGNQLPESVVKSVFSFVDQRVQRRICEGDQCE